MAKYHKGDEVTLWCGGKPNALAKVEQVRKNKVYVSDGKNFGLWVNADRNTDWPLAITLGRMVFLEERK